MSTQTQQQRQTSTSLREKVHYPTRYIVFIINDDFTTFEFVVKLLMEVFDKSESEGWTIACQTNDEGKGIVGIYTKDIALTKIRKATAMAREEGFPLKLDMEPYMPFDDDL